MNIYLNKDAKSLDGEIWNTLPNYESRYECSNLGRVKSLIGKEGKRKEKIISQSFHVQGYLKTSICYKNIEKTISVHRLIALSFIENPENKREVNHKNGIKTDNCVENLEWVTPSENVQHSYNTGLHRGSMFGKKGGNHNGAKKVTQFDISGNIVNKYNSIIEASDSTGIKSKTISDACLGRQRAAGGYIWRASICKS